MVCLPYFTPLALLLVFPVLVYTANILSLNDNVSEDFKFIKEKSSFQEMQPIKVFLYIYENIHTGWCMQVVNFNLMLTEDSIDFFMVSCDLKGPFKMENSMIIVNNLGYLGVKEHYPIWGLFVMPQGYCVQRRYTDHNWDFLEEIEEMDLTMQQCSKVIRSGKPLRAAVSKVDVTSLAPEKLPKIGVSTAKIISLDDSFVDEYVRDESKHNDKEGEGDVAKLTVYHLRHEQTGECARFISINSIYTEDFLDYIVITCDEEHDDIPVIAEDMIEYAGLVYVRDHSHEPIWAIFVMTDCSAGACEKFCFFKVYTDSEQFKLQPRNQNKLTWSQCLNLMNHKDINGLWSTEGTKPTLVTVKRTYEEVVEMLQVDLAPTSESSPNPVGSVSEKSEGPGYQAVPQPEPKAPLVIQDLETVTAEGTTHNIQSTSVLPSPSPAPPAVTPTPTSPTPPAKSSPPQEGSIFSRKLGFFSGRVSSAADNFGLVTKQVTSYIPTNMDEARKKLEEQRQILSQQLQGQKP